jgi:hypothetical protein
MALDPFNGRRVAVDSNGSTARAEPIDNGLEMPPAAERGVEVGSVRFDLKRINGFPE